MEIELIKIADEEVKTLPRVAFDGPVEVIEDFREQNAAADFLLQYNVIGFDTESRASFQKGVENKIALVQFYAGGRAFLIRINKVKLSQGMLKLLQSPDHIKVGVALREDIRDLQGVTDFEPRGFFDLQRVMSDVGIGELGLKKISAIVLGIQISKAQRLSNWEAVTLTDSQIIYAATDAWVCCEIFNSLDITDEILKKGEATVTTKLCEARNLRKRYQRIVDKNKIENSLDDKS